MSISTEVSRKIPAGWYPCRDDRARRRWWNGVEWTEYYAPLQKPNLRLVDKPTPALVAFPPHNHLLSRVLIALVCSLAGLETVLAVLLLAHNSN